MKDWTPEEIEVMTKLWRDGHSASHIAARLGGRSRNSVISYVHRKLKGVRAPRVRSSKPNPIKSPSRPNYSPDVMKPEAAPQPPAASGIHPAPRMVALVDLKANECRWPVGDPREAGFGFCGHPGFPYCWAHARIAFVPSHERRRAA